jgi:hypothetical protein
VTLDELRRMKPGTDRVKAITEYIEQGEAKIADARKLRDADIRALAAEHGPAQAARMSGLSLSTVKLVRGRP